MPKTYAVTVLALLITGPLLAADDEHHSHPAPEKLGSVSFPTSCAPAVQSGFERGMALLHSFAYSVSEQAFRDVVSRDPNCAIAYWGIAMTRYHQLWEVPAGDELRAGTEAIRKAADLRSGSPRERRFIDALSTYYTDADQLSPAVRAERYAKAMSTVARENAGDMESQIFYALALIATASPTDKTHSNQKQALAILEPLYRSHPQHPGLAHYVIHATDSTEMASQGLAAARAYSKIAPSAPHALHMPSHIFTRLGLWDDSVVSNRAARAAAHDQGDTGEELHAMDYLTYAYLQRGREAEAQQILGELHSMTNVTASQFKEGYAATAMGVRYAVERHDWERAASVEPLAKAPPHVRALAYWAQALGRTRGAHPQSSDEQIARIDECRRELIAAKNDYWATQVDVLLKEAQAWRSASQSEPDAALRTLRAAADQEDALEKLPVTPGPVVPAREQLGELLLTLKRPQEALTEFRAALTSAPRRRGATLGAIAAAEQLGDTKTVTQLRADSNR